MKKKIDYLLKVSLWIKVENLLCQTYKLLFDNLIVGILNLSDILMV